MTTAIALLGKTGDILNSLPIAKHLADAQGHPVDWIVSFKYATVLSGASYVNPIKVPYYVHDLQKALNIHKAKYEKIVMLQTFGKTWGGRRDLPHNLVAWLNAGFTEAQFHDLKSFPLVLDRRDPCRERVLVERHVKSNQPLILLSVGCGRSAPFAANGVFTQAINRKWGMNCHILNLCKFKAPRFYDLLGLMERARLLITTDSSPLHLATAIPTLRVVALAPDNSYTGARPRNRTVPLFRYGQVIGRMKEVHEAVFSGLKSEAEISSPDQTEFSVA